MNRFNGPDDGREKEQDRDVRPNWYDTLGREPGQMSKEPTLAQMRKIKEESTMKHAYVPTRNKGKMALGAIVAAGVIFGGVWGANSAGWLGGGTPNPVPAQIAGQTQNAPGSGGSHAGGTAGGGYTDEQDEYGTTAEHEAAMEGLKVAEAFKRADLEVTEEQRKAYQAAFDGGADEIETWVEQRRGELLPYAEQSFLSNYMLNRMAALPYQAAENMNSELMIQGVEMYTREVDLDKRQVVIDYTFSLAFSKDHDPLEVKGTFYMQQSEDGWKVAKDVPDKASLNELYNLARPEAPVDGS